MKRSTILLLLAFSLIAVACPVVNPDDPTPTPEPTPIPTPTPVSDSTTVSIAATRKIAADALLDGDLAKMLTLSDNGTYALDYAGEPITLALDGLKNFDGGRPFRKYCNFPISYNFNLGAKPSVPSDAASGEFDLSTVMPAKVNLGSRSKGTVLNVPALPDGLTYLESITLTENSRVSVTLSLLEPPFTGGTVTPSFSVDMRHFFESPEAEDGILKFDAPLNKENKWSYTKVFRLSGAVFEPENYDAAKKSLAINAKIGLSGSVAFNGLKATRSSIASAGASMLLNVTVVLYDVACETITGRFEFKSKAQSGTLGMSGLSSSVSKMVDVSSASIRLDLANDMPLPTHSTASLTTRRSHRIIGKAEGIVVDAPAASDENAASGYRILSSSDADGKKLLSETPDELNVSCFASTDPDALSTVPMGRSYANTLKPSFLIPLALNKNFTAVIRDTLSAPSQLKAALKKGPAVLQGEVVNTLPLTAKMSVKMIDANGAVLTKETSMNVRAGATVPINMVINNSAGDGIDRLSNTVVTFSFSGTDSPKPIKQSDAIQADLKVRFAND